MAELKISQLPTASTALPLDLIMLVQNGVNKQITLTALLANLNSSDNISINSSRAPISVTVSSPNLANLLHISGTNDAIGINTNNPAALLHVNGLTKIGSSSSDGVIIHSDEQILYSATSDSPQGISWFKPINTSRDISQLQIDTGVATAQFDLGNGSVGQYKLLTMTSFPSGSKSTIRVLGGVSFNRIDLTSLGQSILLKCISIGGISKWIIISNYNSVVYTV